MISDVIVDQFQRDGAVCLRALFNTAELDDLRRGIDWN
jgi:hypothetical protein